MTDIIFAAAYHGLGGKGEVPRGIRHVPVDFVYRDPNHTKSYVPVQLCTAGKVKVPLSSLVSNFADGVWGSFIMSCGNSFKTIGDSFLRSVYTVLDQETWNFTTG